ncbi:MAG: hypothetical protein QNK23_18715 [Crocinitomicaceae bacterium]|nr:hypothetical protein [Crocinitomicaceae bacterium]
MRFILILICLLNFSAFSQMELEWSFFHPIKKEWIELGTKGSVQEALIASGELPDPFYGTNEEKFGWIEEHEWIFKSIFFLESDISEEFAELVFPSIDTYARIYLNDSLVLITDNALIPHSVQVKENLRVGMNELEIIFTPPVMYHKDKKKVIGYELPAPNDVHDNAIAPYTRKPQYQFGWDWALRMNTIGLNKVVELLRYDKARLIGKLMNVIELSEEKAVLDFTFTFNQDINDSITCLSSIFGAEPLKLVNGVVTRRIVVDSPKLWWPRGQGEQDLYKDELQIITEGGDYWIFPMTFGIKTSELIQETDEWGTSYYFKINGRRIFAKGADYIPQEIFPAQVTDSAVEAMVETMAESNFNMVRVWGGGYYPDEVFFNKCDELGIMVWEDLMFACAMYPGDSVFLENVSREFEYQVPRIAAHPSVVLFNGNNEVEVAWGNWGFQVKYGLYGQSARDIEQAYDDIFKKIAPNIINKYTSIPYVHTSPLSNWGKMDLYNHGSQHYWGVWHGKDPLEDFGKKIGRFNAEYGFQSFPEYQTLSSFSEPADWDLKSAVMKHHQKSYVGNDMILKHARRLYGEPENFEEFVYFSQLTQAMAVSMAVAGHRLDAPRCGGTLYWQLNDCWPAPTWSSIDYFGNWKALQYQMKKDFQDVSIVAKYNSLTEREFFLVSDAPDTLVYDVVCTIHDLKGEVLGTRDFSTTLKGESSFQLDVSDILSEPLEDLNVLIVFKFKDNNGEHSYRQFENIGKKYKKAKCTDVTLEITQIDEEKRTAVIEINADKFMRNVWISSNVSGVKFKTNFEHFLPGNHYIEIQFEEIPKKEDFKLMWL